MPSIKERIDDARDKRGQKRRKFNRKVEARKDARNAIGRARWRINEREELRANARQQGRTQRVAELSLLIQDDRREIKNLEQQLKDLTRRIAGLKEAVARLEGVVRRLVRRARRRRKRREHKCDTDPGAPDWSGCECILDREADEVAADLGYYETSGKRTETFGNPGSDHHTSQVTASARDYKPGVALAIAIARVLGIGYRGYADDYKFFYIKRFGRVYRVQIIAQNHGTGPHNHVGIRFVRVA